MDFKIRYVIISPVRDEENYIEKTIKSVISQSNTPLEWIIVNDGSTDNTQKIIQKYVSEYSWIKLINRKNRGYRKAGGGVIEAFYCGYQQLKTNDWEYIVKLDGDLSFDTDYFEKCFNEFQKSKKLGIGGGEIYSLVDGELEEEKNPLFHVRGATKIYRRKCWEDIGSLIQSPGWDTIDEVKANQLGWETRRFKNIEIVQLKFTGAADGFFNDNIKNGKANYICGYHPLFMIIKCINRTMSKPFVVGAIGLFWGFFNGYLYNIPRVGNKALIEYLRKQQLRRLFFMKTIWK